MAFCSKCGKQVGEGSRFCPACGASLSKDYAPPRAEEHSAGDKNHYGFDPADVSKNKAMGILAYLGILVLIPVFAAKESRFARFHANQGLILFILEVCLGVLSWFFEAIFLNVFHIWSLYGLLNVAFRLLDIACLGLSIYGIVNAAQGTRRELPVIGKLRLINE